MVVASGVGVGAAPPLSSVRVDTMSWQFFDCERCFRRLTVAQLRRKEHEHTMAVIWRCDCGWTHADIFGIRSFEPRPGRCLQCGRPRENDHGCVDIAAMVEAHRDDSARTMSLVDEVNTYMRRGRVRLALDLIDVRLTQHPDDVDAWAIRGNAYCLLEYPSDGARSHLEAVRLAPDCPPFILMAAEALLVAGENEALMQLCETALARVSGEDRARLLHARAEALCEMHRGEEALADIDEALEDPAERPRRLYVRGRALGLVGRGDEAGPCFESILEIDPDNEDAKHGLAMLVEAKRAPTAKKPWWKIF